MTRHVKLPSFPKISPAAKAALITAGSVVAGSLGAEVGGKVLTERLLTRFPGLRGKAKAARGRPASKKPAWVRQPRQLKKLSARGGGGAGDEPRDDHGRWTR